MNCLMKSLGWKKCAKKWDFKLQYFDSSNSFLINFVCTVLIYNSEFMNLSIHTQYGNINKDLANKVEYYDKLEKRLR